MPGRGRVIDVRREMESTKKILTEQLRELERDGIVERKSYPEPRPRVEYRLTAAGRSMIVFLDKMSEWGEKHIFSKP
ncbi:winged helix-turn-helix transcriptional regulator [Cohnella soli]|uniref:Winged helix-turn-helix transcriptional regulator n=1 Tax=Cohnella soli TaxID=425005 RepID=A0ABW0HZP9_9BACL